MRSPVENPAVSWILYLSALMAGAVLALALPPLNLWPAMFPAMAGALWLLRQADGRVWTASLSGFLFGLGYFLVAFHWIGFAFLIDAATYLWMMPFAVLGLAAFMALYWAAAFAVAAGLWRRRVPGLASLPALLALVEWLRGHLFTGFPWAAPGLMADGMGGVLQLASLMGMPGLTYAVLLWGAIPAILWAERRAGFRQLMLPVALLGLLPLSWAWGQWRLAAIPAEDVPGVSLALVQPNISQDDKWRSDNAAAILDKLLALSTSAVAAGASHVIWPESAVPFLLDESDEALSRIAQALQPGQVLITGAIRREAASGAGAERYHTSILAVDDAGRVAGTYDKWRLVPGGEYLPLAFLLEPLGFRKVVSLPESFTAGPGPGSFDLGAAGRAGLLICYEAIFPHRLVEEGRRPQWLINVTNDGWFGNSVGPYQHMAQVRMRAVEQGLPVARAANTGISAIVDAVGRVRGPSRLGSEAVIAGPLPKALPQTPFARHGNLLAVVMAIVCAAAIWFGQIRKLS
jgi:apolipoprotein N-acyltransferase